MMELEFGRCPSGRSAGLRPEPATPSRPSAAAANAVRFNLNHWVRVKLTPRGRYILERRNAEYRSTFGGSWALPAEDEEGWSTWQLWSLMEELGPHIAMGVSVPFETEIELLLPCVSDSDRNGEDAERSGAAEGEASQSGGEAVTP